MKKGQSKVVIILLAIIAVALVVIAIKFFAPRITGNVVTDNQQTSPQNDPRKFEYGSSQNQPANTNNDDEIINQATDFYRECLSGCPNECVSCDVLSIKCTESCGESYGKKRRRGNELSGEWITGELNDRNLKWNACIDACIIPRTEGNSMYTLKYNCLHSC